MMFSFYLKKIIGMLLMPLPFSLVLLLLALLFWQRLPKFSKALVSSALIFLALTSWHPISDRLINAYEEDYPQFDLQQPVEVVVVLGGGHSSDANMPPAAQLSASSLYRLIEGLRILEANPQAKIHFSGYSGTDNRPHAVVMKEVALAMGVQLERINIYPEPKDTQEEARVMRDDLSGKTFALVTENSHLPRAMRFFESEGLRPIAAPAFKMSSEKSDWRFGASAALKSERAAYEFWGGLWQKLKLLVTAKEL